MRKQEQFSLRSFQNIYTKIVDTKNNPDPEKFPELLSQMGKQLIWGDHHETDYFQYFCQVKALDVLLEIFGKTKSKQIVTAIIGFFNILLTNITRKDTITYLLSHPCVLSLQNIKFVSLDSEIAQYYINFLKGLSRKIDANSLHLFFNKKYPNFPLLMQTTRFYNHPQNLVRTTCRNILLSCSRFNNKKMKDFVCGFPFIMYFIHECNFLKEYWIIIDSIVDSEGDNKYQLSNLDNIVEDQVQILVYFDDFMRINDTIAQRFLDAFTNECLCSLIQGLYSYNKANFSIKVILFVCALLLKNITTPIFIEFLVYALFGKYYTKELCFKLIHPVERPISYSKEWKFKGFWDGYQADIIEYCGKAYHNTEKIMSDVKAQKYRPQSVQQTKYSYNVKSIFGLGTNFYSRQIEKLQHIFGIQIKSDSKTIKKSTSTLMAEFQKVLGEPLDLKHYEENPVRQVIISYLSSKDDSLVILSLNLIKQVLDNKHVSEKMTNFCSLNINPKQPDFGSMITIQKIIKNCLCIMEVEPPSFRICTFKLASQLVSKLSKVYHGQNTKIPPQLLEISKSALKIAIERITPYLYGNQEWEKALQIFNKMEMENSKNKLQTLHVFGLVPREQIAKQSALEDVYDNFPQNPQQQMARDFWLYLIIRNTYCYLTGEQYQYQVVNCDQKGKEKASIFQIGLQYSISQDQIVDGCYKEINEQLFQDCDIIFLGGYVVIGKQKKVQYKCSYQEAMMTVDRSDPRKVLLSMGRTMLAIGVQTVKKAYEMRKHFLQMKALMFKYQLSLLVKQTEWLLSSIQKQK